MNAIGVLVQASAGAGTMTLTQFQAGFQPLLVGLIGALVLTLWLAETGTAARNLPGKP